jgi:hypothetical protein
MSTNSICLHFFGKKKKKRNNDPYHNNAIKKSCCTTNHSTQTGNLDQDKTAQWLKTQASKVHSKSPT